MTYDERSRSVLVVSSSEKFRTALTAMLPDGDFQTIVHVPTVTAAKRAFSERNYDFVMINSPLKDSSGIEFALDTSSARGALVLFLAGSEFFSDVSFKLSESGIFSLQKPISRQSLENAMRWLETTKNKLDLLEKKTEKIEDKMEEIRLINRAKWLLISEGGMLEPEAHRFLEKEAMDRCVSKKQVAEEIIRRYKE